VPVRKFLSISNISSFERSKISAGMVPFNLLLSKSSRFKFLRLASDGGMLPLKLFESKFMEAKNGNSLRR